MNRFWISSNARHHTWHQQLYIFGVIELKVEFLGLGEINLW